MFSGEDENGVNDSSKIETENDPHENSTTAPIDIESGSMVVEQCSICLEELKTGDKVYEANVCECGHKFHLECILAWLIKHNTCPCCRAELFPVDESQPCAVSSR